MMLKIIGSMIVSGSICVILCACSAGIAGKSAVTGSPAQERITPGNAASVVLLRSFQIPDYQPGDLSQCSLDFSPDGSLLVGACGNNPVPVWNVASGEVQFSLYQDHPVQIVACAFSPDGAQIACGGFDNKISLWDAVTGDKLVELGTHASPVWEVSYNPDGSRIVSAGLSDDIRLWDVTKRQMVWASQGIRGILSVSFSPDGNRIAYGTRLGVRAGILDAATGDRLTQFQEPKNNVGDIIYNSTGKMLAAGCDDNKIYLWDGDSFILTGELTGHNGFVNGLAFNPKGGLMASGSHDKTVGIWDLTTHEPLTFLSGHKDVVLRVAFNPQGTLLASISWDGTVKLWGIYENH
jgi:WD40 repeat protein